jgi:hypothetical protein
MPELEYFVAAESHAVDRDTNAISIFNVFSERKFDKFPVIIPRLALISSWIASPAEIEARAEFQVGLTLRGDQRKEEPFLINCLCDSEFQNVVVVYNLLEVSQPSRLQFELLLNGKHTANHTISIKSSDPDE